MQPIVAETEDSYRDAMNAVERALERFKNSSDVEKEKLRQELAGLRAMHDKMQCGRVEIVVFGEISVGKSALINALIGRDVAAVDVRGGWTKEVWQVAWDGAGYCLPGLGVSQVVLVDTPGINEVGGSTRGERAREAAQRALFDCEALLILDGAEEAIELNKILSIRGRCGVLLITREKRIARGKTIFLDVLPLEQSIHVLQAWSSDEYVD